MCVLIIIFLNVVCPAYLLLAVINRPGPAYVCVSPDVCADKWPCGNVADSVQSQDREGGVDCESDITFGEMEQRLDLLQEHLNR